MAKKPATEPPDPIPEPATPDEEGAPVHAHLGPTVPPKWRTPMEDPAHPLHHLRNT